MSPVDHHKIGLYTAEGFEPTTSGFLSSHGSLILASTFLGLIILARYIASRTANQKPFSNNFPSVVSEAVAQQRLWALEKSRGVSRSALSMPTKSSPQDPASWGEDGLDTPNPASLNTTSYPSMGEASKGTKDSPEAGAQSWTMQSRPRPPPPLTPPVLSGGPLSFGGRPTQSGHSSVVDFDRNFFGLPNPDYMSATSDLDSVTSSFRNQSEQSATPRRRSYTRVLPFAPDQERHGITSEAITNQQQMTSGLLSDSRNIVVDSREVNVQGEIISVLDDAGAGWKRHTRVYGGGVCLACLESEGKEGGGFYGANVRPEDRRH